LKLDSKQYTNPSGRKIDINIITSNFHCEVNPSDVGVSDRVIVQELIKDMATSTSLSDKHRFKVVVITEADKLTIDAQHGLRRTMEKYINTLRIILIGNSSSRIIPAIRSRCYLVRVAAPSER
jgi:replication factor C subunit 3/5